MKPEQRFDRSLIEGPVLKAVWKLAWPTMLQNMIAGLQGIIDHSLVGNLVGFVGNAAIGVSWQIFLVVVVFVSSLFSGMGVLVARFAGAGNSAKVNRTVYQAFLTAIAMACLVMAPVGYLAAPFLLDLVLAAPEVKAEALPYIRILLVSSVGMLLFFMLGGALRAAGDARTPLRLGIYMTTLNLVLSVILIRGFGPIPGFGTAGAAMGTVIAPTLVSSVGIYLLFSGRLVVRFSRTMDWRPDWKIIGALFRFGLPTGFQGIAMNVAGVILLRFIGSLPQSAQAQAAFTVGYTQLFSLITWTSVGLMGATAALAGQNLGAGRPERSRESVAASAVLGLSLAFAFGLLFLLIPQSLLRIFGMVNPEVVRIGEQLLRYLSISGLFVTVALAYTGGLQGTGDTRSPLYITLVSQIGIPLSFCGTMQILHGLEPRDVWVAIVLGHFARAVLSFLRFRQGKWMAIRVEIEQ